MLSAVGFAAAPLGATCGGGGGGGAGGIDIGSGLSAEPQVYQVPWTVLLEGVREPAGAVAVYWFPTGPEEARRSPLQNSRPLSVAAGRCVGLSIAPAQRADLRQRFGIAEGELPGAVVIAPEGGALDAPAVTERLLAGPSGQSALLAQIEQRVQAALRARERALDEALDRATALEKAGRAADSIAAYGAVWRERCTDPAAARKAARALKRLGASVEDPPGGRAASEPRTGDAALDARLEALIASGLAAERAGRYDEAGDRYRAAVRLDPGDAVARRYLGELERHHTGDWAAATRHFETILRTPTADPISRAVALHGLGKMTIHADRFAEGLALIERSIATWPLPLAYRNLAVYWNSEGQMAKAQAYAEQAHALAPDDPYNQVFLAVFLAEDGRREEALEAARRHGDLLEASYNLAVIHTLAGDPRTGLALLRRHFHEYERYDAVRAKEMREAREDIGFLDLRQDPEFLALTRMADDPRFAWPERARGRGGNRERPREGGRPMGAAARGSSGSEAPDPATRRDASSAEGGRTRAW